MKSQKAYNKVKMSIKRRKIFSIIITILNVAALGACAVGAAYELRANNVRSGELYQLVQAADESGVGVENALQNLQVHVTTHMNASPLPQLGDNAPVQLSNSYQRAKTAETERVSAERERVTQDGIIACETQFGSSNLTTRSQCIANYGAAHPVSPEKEIIVDLYRYDFASPTWSPDNAGWLVIASLVLAAILVLRIVTKIVAIFILRN